jgi:ribosomal protein L12E/L44/L45/RPP1/RPP2
MMNENQVETLKTWLERFKRSEDFVRPQRDRGKENYKLYKMYKNQSEKVYKHDMFVPYSFAFLEDLAAYFMLSVVASPTLFTIEPRWQSVDTSMCKALETIINWSVLEERTEFALEIEEMLKNLNLYNSAYLINYPVMMEVDSRHPETGDIIQGSKVEAFDYLHLDAPHPFLMFPEPGPKRLSRSNWLIKQSFETYDNLKAWERDKIYKNLGDIKKGDQTSEVDPVETMLSSIGMGSVEYNRSKIEILDCFSDGDVVTIANRRAIIRDTTEDAIRPYSFDLPALDCRFAGAPGEFDGMGAMEVTKPLQRELNLLRSQRRENVALILNKLFKYDMMAGEVDLTTLFSAPGNVIVEQGDCISELPITDITASSYKEEQSLIYDLQSVLSFWDYGRGATPRRKETATGIIRLQQAAQARNEWHLRKLDAYVLQPLCRRIITYLRESLPKADAVAIVGKEYAEGINRFYALETRDLRRLLHVRPMTDSISSIKEIDTNMFLQAFDRLIKIQGVNVTSLIKILLEKLGQRNIKEIIQSVPTPAGQDATAQALAKMKSGQAGPEGEALLKSFSAGGQPNPAAAPASPISGMEGVNV